MSRVSIDREFFYLDGAKLRKKIPAKEVRRNLALIRLHRDLTDLLDTYADETEEDGEGWLEWSRRMRDDLSRYLREKGYARSL